MIVIYLDNDPTKRVSFHSLLPDEVNSPRFRAEKGRRIESDWLNSDVLYHCEDREMTEECKQWLEQNGYRKYTGEKLQKAFKDLHLTCQRRSAITLYWRGRLSEKTLFHRKMKRKWQEK